MNQEQMIAELTRLKAENEALKAKKQARLSLKITEKGGVSLYGMGRFPVTLYMSQWQSLLGHAKEIESFIVANASKLANKEDKPVVKQA